MPSTWCHLAAFLFSSEPLSDPAQFARKRGEAPHRADSRRKREIEMEQHAMQCISLYLTVMAFAQKAIDIIRAHCQRDENRSPGTGVDEGVFFPSFTILVY